MGRLRVTEIFHSIQGESSHAGRPCVFVRLTGCPLRCRWCDTEYAFQGGESLELEEILERVGAFDCSLVEVTGGEPLAQSECPRLLRALADSGYEVLLETSGALSTESVDPRVKTILDLKCPDSGEGGRNLWENLDRLGPHDEIKLVIAGREDYEWAAGVVRSHRLDRWTVHFSPVWGEVDPGELARWILEDRLPVRMQLQMHKVLFGAETRGV